MNQDQMEKSIKRIPLETAASGLAFGILAGLVFDLITGVLVLAGAVLAGISFFWLRGAVDRWLTQPRAKLMNKALVLYLFRLGLICLIFLIIIFIFKRKIIAFVAGFSIILVVVLIEALIILVSIKQWKV